MWVVVQIMVPFWVLRIIRHLVFRGPPKRDHSFENHPCVYLHIYIFMYRELPHIFVYLESQWPIIMGYFQSIMGYFGVWWPIFLGFCLGSPCVGPLGPLGPADLRAELRATPGPGTQPSASRPLASLRCLSQI